MELPLFLSMREVIVIAILGRYGDSYNVVISSTDNSISIYAFESDGYDHINIEALDYCTKSWRIAKKWYPKIYH